MAALADCDRYPRAAKSRGMLIGAEEKSRSASWAQIGELGKGNESVSWYGECERGDGGLRALFLALRKALLELSKYRIAGAVPSICELLVSKSLQSLLLGLSEPLKYRIHWYM